MTGPTPSTQTGVCVVRAEVQGDDALLITVTSNPDIEMRTPTRLSRHARDIATAVELVADFLREVASVTR